MTLVRTKDLAGTVGAADKHTVLLHFTMALI